MEAVEEHITNLSDIDVVKSNTLENEEAASAVAANLCHKSNGVVEIVEAGQPIAGGNESETLADTEIVQDSVVHTEIIDSEERSEMDVSSEKDTIANEIDKTSLTETSPVVPPEDHDSSSLDVNEVVTEVVIAHDTDKSDCHETDIKMDVIETPSDATPKFKTEILIEANDSMPDTPENTLTDADEHGAPKNLLSEFGESIELSDVLRSDITVSSENNNSSVRQEVFNKEELLDILEGNDVDLTSEPVTDGKSHTLAPSVETKLALQQLSRLKNQKRRYRLPIRTAKVKKEIKEVVDKEKHNFSDTEEQVEKIKSNQMQTDPNVEVNKVSNVDDKNSLEKKKLIPDNSNKSADNDESGDKTENSTKKRKASKDVSAGNIVNVLVMDWDDEEQEPTEPDQTKDGVADSGDVINETEKPIEDEKDDKPLVKSAVDSGSNEDQTQKPKSGDENQPQRRLGRVIKKKVIFDPDNPDTFTKTKAKNREASKEHIEKEPTTFKKGKVDHTPQRSKSKSPMSNLQWKKPSSKNNKQNKRLTEVDRLLMDEGAVNMIYQLTPEAPKGKKSRETKAEFIKKIQSSTPDSKEMKFRERKKEILKYEDGEAKKILGAKHRVSLNSSIKSPSVSEDFETHSADDSIIYRRHSSSSYSSSCMSPRRLSDVDSCSAQATTRQSQPTSDNQSPSTTNADQVTDVFMSENANKSNSEIINKDDYLSIKEKLNSKLSLALNKRKRESTKNEKPTKQKKLARSDEKNENVTKSLGEFKYVTIKINQRLAEICIEKIGVKYNLEVLKEIEQALAFVNTIKDTSVTLLTSECGTLCSSLDVKHIIEEDKVQRIKNALEVAETIRSLLVAVDKHSKLLCAGVRARCSGLGLALAALADVLLASEAATFAVTDHTGAPQPAVGALSARCRLPQSMINDLVLFGRQLSASEALQGGLVSKILWPNRFNEQVYSIAKDIAADPVPSVMLKKQLINLKKTEENEQSFLTHLDAERNIFVEYWTSVEGQELLRAAQQAA